MEGGGAWRCSTSTCSSRPFVLKVRNLMGGLLSGVFTMGSCADKCRGPGEILVGEAGPWTDDVSRVG